MQPALRATVEQALRSAGAGALREAHELGGGSFGATLRVDAGTQRFFLKLGAPTHPFDAEAQALEAIAATHTLRAPRALAHGVAAAHGFLLLEWIDFAAAGDWSAAGAQLAALHAVEARQFGWRRDNSIGASPQFNAPCADWAGFWRERRLRPQFALARTHGLDALAAREAAACAAGDALLGGQAPPASLLHGDLWRGNLAFDRHGQPVVFDPACYHGDAETDLAMAHLFGGFPSAFFAAYAAARPPRADAVQRQRLYHLYHVLNHANLFGGGYVTQACALIDDLSAA